MSRLARVLTRPKLVLADLALNLAKSYSTAPKPYYASSPIFYVNASPHIGHLYSMTMADILCRWHGFYHQTPVFMTTGTDEHGLKVEQAARQSNVEPQAFADLTSGLFRRLANQAGIKYNKFMRTTSRANVQATQELWTRLAEAGYIYKGSHSGWYCVSDETFYPETRVELRPDGTRVSKETGKEVEWASEDNYFFALSKMQQPLLDLYQSGTRFIEPASKLEQMTAEVKAGLSDLSVSRPRSRSSWGVAVPGDDSQTVYVWFDALVNYLAASGFPKMTPQSPWPADVHVVGKDIVRFHGMYWPAFLLAAGLPTPKQIMVHSHWTLDGVKMSKSLGNIVDPHHVMSEYGVDTTRLFFCYDGHLDHDSVFSGPRLASRHNIELVNKYGNLVMRLCGEKLDLQAAMKGLHNHSSGAESLVQAVNSLADNVQTHIKAFDFPKAMDQIWAVIGQANTYFQDREPWKIKDAEQKHEVLRNAAEAARVCSIVLQPFIPGIASKILDRLAVGPDSRTVDFARFGADKTYPQTKVNYKGGHVVTAVPEVADF